jgi:hypothetical protein
MPLDCVAVFGGLLAANENRPSCARRTGKSARPHMNTSLHRRGSAGAAEQVCGGQQRVHGAGAEAFQVQGDELEAEAL